MNCFSTFILALNLVLPSAQAISLEPVKTLSGFSSPKSVWISPDGHRAWVNDLEGRKTFVYDTSNFSVKGVIRHEGKPVEFGPSPDGATVWISWYRISSYSVTSWREVRESSYVVAIDARTLRQTAKVPVGKIPKILCMSHDGSRLYVSNWASHTVTVVDTSTCSPVATIPVGWVPRGLALSSSGSILYVANMGGGTLSLVDTHTDRVIRTVSGTAGKNLRHLVTSRDGTKLYISNNAEKCTRKLSLPGLELLGICRSDGRIRTVAISSDGKWLFAANYDSGTVEVIRESDMSRVGSFASGKGTVGLAVSPDGSYLWAVNQPWATVKVFKILPSEQ